MIRYVSRCLLSAMDDLEEALCVTDGERLRASYRCDRRNDAKGRYRPWDSAEG